MIKLFMENMYDNAAGLLHYIIPDVSKDEYLEIKEAAKDIGIHLDSIYYDGQVVKITFSQYDRKTHEKCYKLYNMFIGDRGLKAESFDKSVLKESYGDLSDYLERHLDSWYGRLNELGDAIEDLGLDVDEINNEYVIVHAAEPDGEDVYCKIWLGGTPRTISLETFEMLESVKRSRNVLRESDDKITARSFQELISKLEDHGYSCEHYYDMKYPESNWLYITKNGDPYEAEFYIYSDGEYELYLHNIHPTRRRNESAKRRKMRENTNMENKMIITVGSSLNADGFDIMIVDKDLEKLFKNSYHYGYNASWKQSWADNDKPYVTDIIKDLCDRYSVPRENIEVTSGKNVFTGSDINNKAVDRFIKNYIDENLKARKTKKKSRRLKEDSSKRYGRYLVKISRYKNMYRLDYIDEHFDKGDYCFFDENGHLDTDYSGISRDLFDKIYDLSMKPGHVYEIYTDGPYGDIIGFEEVPYGWFRY